MRPRERSAIAVHLATLALTAAVLLWIDRGQWFAGDDWAPIADRWDLTRPATLLDPHNEHWSTLPILVYRGLYAAVGLHSYLPYVAVTVLLHVLAASAAWRVAVRGGADRWVATGAAGVFLLSAAGAENLTWAFQMGFVGAVWLGLEHVLLLDRQDRRLRDDGLALLAGVAALMTSGIGLVMVVAGGVVALVRRGLLRAALLAGTEAAVYGAWYLAFGRFAARPGPHGASAGDLARYVFRGLAGTVGQAVRLPALGGELLAVLAVALVVGLAQHDRARWVPAAALAGSAALFFALTGVARVATFGVQSGGATSRYLYVGVALLVPAAALALSPIARLRGGGLVVAGLAVVPMWLGAQGIAAAARAQEPSEQALRVAVSAVAATADQRPPLGQALLTPNLDVAELLRLRADGALPAVPIAEADRRAATTFLRVTMTDEPLRPLTPPPVLTGSHEALVTPTTPGCVDVAATDPDAWIELQFAGETSLHVAVRPAGDLSPALVDGTVLAPSFRTLHVAGEGPHYLNVGIDDARLRLGGVTGVLTTLCGLG